MALRRRARRGDRLRRGRPPGRTTRSAPATSPTAPTTSCRTPRRVDYDDSGWELLAPAETHAPARARAASASTGTASRVTIPERVGDLDPTGATVVFEVVIDDYAEVWVDGELPLALGDTGGHVVGGFNAPNRVVLTRDARPGETLPDRRVRHQRPDLGLAAQLHLDAHGDARLLRARARAWASPRPLEVERLAPGLDAVVGDDARLERVAGGFEFTEGPVWTRDGALLFSSPNTNAIYRWDPAATVDGLPLQERLHRHRHRPLPPARLERPDVRPRRAPDDLPARQPARDPRRAARRHVTVLADRYDGRRLNRPTTSSTARTARSSSPTRRSGCPGSSTTRPRSCRSAASSPSATAT